MTFPRKLSLTHIYALTVPVTLLFLNCELHDGMIQGTPLNLAWSLAHG